MIDMFSNIRLSGMMISIIWSSLLCQEYLMRWLFYKKALPQEPTILSRLETRRYCQLYFIFTFHSLVLEQHPLCSLNDGLCNSFIVFAPSRVSRQHHPTCKTTFGPQCLLGSAYESRFLLETLSPSQLYSSYLNP